MSVPQVQTIGSIPLFCCILEAPASDLSWGLIRYLAGYISEHNRKTNVYAVVWNMPIICLYAYKHVLFTNFCFATFLNVVRLWRNKSTFTKLIIRTYGTTKGQVYPYIMKQLPKDIPITGQIRSLVPKLATKRRWLVSFMQLVVQCRGADIHYLKAQLLAIESRRKVAKRKLLAAADGRKPVLQLTYWLKEFYRLVCLHKEQFWGYVTYRKTFLTNFLSRTMCG